MEVKIIKKEDKKAKLYIDGIEEVFLNLLRRFYISEIPTLGIDKIIIYENKTPFFDEYIGNRIGLIPLTQPKPLEKYKDTHLRLNVEGEKGGKTIYSSEIESPYEELKAVYDNIPLLKLEKDQILRIEMKLNIGKGKEHAKYQQGLMSFVQTPNPSEEKWNDNEEGKGGYSVFLESYSNRDPLDLLNESFDLIINQIRELKEKIKEE